ncbi:MAG: SDR family oxidoreductase, partial [Anaerolineales bacterium]
MILVTGATGFVGRALVPRLADMGADLRCLIRPSEQNPQLPRGVPVQVAVASLPEFRGIRAAMVGVDTIIHLAGSEWRGSPAALMQVDYEGSRKLLEAAVEAGVRRIVYISHLGADRASAYGLQKVKGLIEEFIRKSGISHTIIRSAIVYGAEDHFTNLLAMLLHVAPGFFPVPGTGKVQLQPLWVEDLVTCIEWCLDEPGYINQTYSVGGPEFLSFNQIVKHVMERTGRRRPIIPVPAPYLRALIKVAERIVPRWPLNSRWLDYLAVNRMCELHSATRFFGIKP